MKRTLSLILVLVCLLSAALSSCSDNTADTETKSSENTSAESEGTETEAETETETELTLNLPEADFGDATCTTLIRDLQNTALHSRRDYGRSSERRGLREKQQGILRIRREPRVC